MAIASITAWLNSQQKDFAHGRLLYEQYGSDPLVLTIIKTGSGSFHFSKLLEALEGLNQLSNIEPKRIVIPDLPAVEKSGNAWDGAPDPILEIRNEKNLRYAQARKLFESIPMLDSKEHRAEDAIKLLDHMDFVKDSWGAIDEWRETGNIRAIKKEEELTAVAELSLQELIQQSKNIATYISKGRAKLAKETDPKKILKIKERIDLWEIKVNEVKRRLDEFV